MNIHMYMNTPAVTVPPSTSLPEAVDLMIHHRIRRLIVAHERDPETPIGIVTRHDIIEHFPRRMNPFSPARSEIADIPKEIGKIMSHPVTTIDSHAPIEDAAALMNKSRIGTLPVMHAGSLVGIITKTDIFKTLVDLLTEGDSAIRVTFAVRKSEDILEFLIGLTRNREIRISSFITFFQEGNRMAVVRLHGRAAPDLIEDLWNSGHNVISVLHKYH